MVELEYYINPLTTFLNSRKNKFLLIKGFAGVGKTSLIKMFLKTIKNKKIAITAPTNNAVDLIRTDLKIDATFGTIQTFLNLESKYNYSSGELNFERNLLRRNNFKIFDLLIIDESSMLEDKILIDILSQKTKCKIIFLGDEFQIPPVNNSNEFIFDKEFQKEFKIEVLELSNILRQDKNNDVIKLSEILRTNINNDIDIYSILKQFNKNIKLIDINNLNEILPKYLPDSIKIIGYTNKTIEKLNDICRSYLFENQNKLIPNEKIIIDSTYSINDNKILYTNEVVTIIDYRIDWIMGFKTYHAKIMNNKNKCFEIKIIHEDSEIMLDVCLTNLSKFNKWKEFYELNNIFCKIKHCYAITCHKAQGNTYENSVIMLRDIMKNKNIKERNRIIYTAFTRSRNMNWVI